MMVNIKTLPINLFCAYAKEDEQFRIELNKHLSSLQREGIISQWHFRMLTAGDDWKGEIDYYINSSQIILLLVTASFMSSDYCYHVEMKTAMKLHNLKKALVVPIILRPVDWKTSPFSKFQALPTDGKPITQWSNQDEAFLDIAQGIRKACQKLLRLKTTKIPVSSVSTNSSPSLETQTTKVYCSLCGAVPGKSTYCTNVLDPHHDFKPYSGKVYCSRCGAVPGKSIYCTNVLDPYHDFKSYSGKVYCAECGATPGRPTYCTNVLDPYHHFKSYP